MLLTIMKGMNVMSNIYPCIEDIGFSPILDGGGNRMKARSAVRRAMNSRRTIPGWEKERGNQKALKVMVQKNETMAGQPDIILKPKSEQQLWDADNGAAPKIDISGD